MPIPLRVLIVEDSPDDTTLLLYHLNKGGYEADYERVDTPEAFEAALEKGNWELILADYSMPYFSGLAALKICKEMKLDIPFIIVSGSIGEDTAVTAMKAGAHDYILKDKTSRLIPAIQRELSESQQRQALKQENAGLSLSETRFNHIFDSSLIGIMFGDIYGNILDANEAFLSLIGYTHEEVLSGSVRWKDLTPAEHLAAADRIIEKLLFENDKVQVYEKQFFNKQRERIDVILSASLLEGSVDKTVCCILDITERKRSEEKLQNAYLQLQKDLEERKLLEKQLLHIQKMESLGQLAAGIAHEINNPVGFIMSNLRSMKNYVTKFKNVIQGYDELIQSAIDADTSGNSQMLSERRAAIQKENRLSYILEDVDNLVSESLDGTDRVQEIVKGLKSFSRMDEGTIQETDLNDCIETTLKVIWNELKYTIHVHKKLGEIPKIPCNAGQLNQVIMNLLVNAAQAIPKQGDITIETFLKGDNIIIRVSDTGEGIPKKHLSHIFTPFYTTKEIGKGTGLGLSISYGIIQKHNGVITVESEVGQGTCFTISLPAQGVPNERQPA